MQNPYRIAFYARISKPDKKNMSVSNSITNQLNLLNDNLHLIKDLSFFNKAYYDNAKNNTCDISEYKYGNNTNLLYNIQTFVDDGFSGRSAKRPEFRRMIALAALGEIDIIMVKDFSRFSRNHLLMSEFREKIFPQLGITFISVADRYDSRSSCSELVASFKSLFNEYYCNDISNKIKNVLSAKKSSGKYAVANVPYGYRISYSPKLNKNEIIINKEEADIIKRIFEMACNGFNCHDIENILNSQNCFAGNKNSSWSAAYIWQILNNPFYTGDYIWHKYETLTESNICQKLPRSNWNIIPDSHDAIIDKEIFNKVNDNIKHIKSSKKSPRHIFHGITKCKICGRALCSGRRKKDYLCCNHCTGKEIKKIKLDLLYQICINSLSSEINKLRLNDKTNHKNILFYNADILSSFLKYKTGRFPFKYENELIIHSFIKKIEIGANNDIDIFFNFK